MYGVSDNPKEALLFGKTLPMPLWEAAIYPVCDSMEEAVHQTLEAWREGFPIREDAISLKDSFNQADLSALLPWQEKKTVFPCDIGRSVDLAVVSFLRSYHA